MKGSHMIDLTKFVDYPIWFKIAVFTWLILTLFLGASSLLVKPNSKEATDKRIEQPQKNIVNLIEPKNAQLPPEEVTVPPTPMPTSGGAQQISLKDYFARLKQLEDRFLQRQEFIDSLSGRTVSWNGYVDKVSSHTDGTLSVMIDVAPGSIHGAIAYFPAKFRTKYCGS
jgi:hypothetical protein